MARGMIANGDHQRLSSVNLRYYYLGHAPKRSGKLCGAYVVKMSELQRVYAGLDQAQSSFCVVIAKPVWDRLDANGRQALLDHGLRHIGFNSKGAPGLQPHDLQEFAATVRSYGLDWSEDVRRFAEACAPHMAQMVLDLEPPRGAVGEQTNGHLEEAA